MKVLILVLCCLSVCLADYSKQEMKALMKAGRFCMKELSIPNESDIIERTMYNRNVTKADMDIVICGMKYLGLMDAEGAVLPEQVVQFFADKYDTDKVRPLVIKCANQKEGDVLERTWKYYQCFFEHMDLDF